MPTITLCSRNIRGLNSKFKHAQLFNYNKTYSPSLLLLQEKHLMGQKILALKKAWVAHHYHAPFLLMPEKWLFWLKSI